MIRICLLVTCLFLPAMPAWAQAESYRCTLQTYCEALDPCLDVDIALELRIVDGVAVFGVPEDQITLTLLRQTPTGGRFFAGTDGDDMHVMLAVRPDLRASVAILTSGDAGVPGTGYLQCVR